MYCSSAEKFNAATLTELSAIQKWVGHLSEYAEGLKKVCLSGQAMLEYHPKQFHLLAHPSYAHFGSRSQVCSSVFVPQAEAQLGCFGGLACARVLRLDLRLAGRDSVYFVSLFGWLVEFRGCTLAYFSCVCACIALHEKGKREKLRVCVHCIARPSSIIAIPFRIS